MDKELQAKVEIVPVGPVDDAEISKIIKEFDRASLLETIKQDSVFRYKKNDPFFFLKISNKSKINITMVNMGTDYFIYPISMSYKGRGRSGTTMNNAKASNTFEIAAGENKTLLTRWYNVDTMLVAYPFKTETFDDGVGIFRQKYFIHEDHLEELEDDMNTMGD